ncbi:hypothetical protein ACMW09_003316 [Cronobacter malonaticus]|nr:hypothetical protein [Cronobacter malonaticus]
MAESKDKILNLDQGEIIALKKAIMYLKFSCEETESLLFSGSPSINSVFAKLLNIDDLGEQSLNFYNKRHPENERFVLSKINKYESESGRSLSESVKEESFRNCLYPFVKK